jgi:hypothetical protein
LLAVAPVTARLVFVPAVVLFVRDRIFGKGFG